MSADYFTYLPENQLCASWGCTVTALGRTRIGPGSPYPPQRHPDDHHFNWEHGRVLDAYQIVFISSGRGTFESSRSRGPQAVQAGSVFVLFPAVWHRYAPDPQVGWAEHWVECRGHAFDSASHSGALSADQPLWAAGAGLSRIFTEIHSWAAGDPLTHQALISAQGLQLLSLLLKEAPGKSGRDDAALIQKAMMRIMQRCTEPLNMRELSRELHLGYTRFRELFQLHAHTSPKQYQLRIRLDRARDLLLNTAKPLKEIAALLGFHSAFHFSNQFRAAHGLSPRAWRQREQPR